MTQPEISQRQNIGLENDIIRKYNFVGFKTAWSKDLDKPAVPVHVFTAGYSDYTPDNLPTARILFDSINDKLNNVTQTEAGEILAKIQTKGNDAKIAVINAKFVNGKVKIFNKKTDSFELFSSSSLFQSLYDQGYELAMITANSFFEETIFDKETTPLPVIFDKTLGVENSSLTLIRAGEIHPFSIAENKEEFPTKNLTRNLGVLDKIRQWWENRYAIPDTEHLEAKELIDLATHYASVVSYDRLAASLAIPGGVLLFGLAGAMENSIPGYLGAISIALGLIHGYDCLRLIPKSNFLNTKAEFDDIEEVIESGDQDTGFVIRLNINGQDINARIDFGDNKDE